MFFQKKTVASVIAGFNKVCDDLDVVADAASERAGHITNELLSLETERDECWAEQDKADAVRQNILKMIGA
jgi:hypothetical protein